MNIYIDESGSMTKIIRDTGDSYFIIAMLIVENPKKLKRAYKRYVSKNIETFKELPKGSRMFNEDKFAELKGSALNPQMKEEFIDYFCKNDIFKIMKIKLKNNDVKEIFYRNKARAFNYIIKLAMEYLYNHHTDLVDREWVINIDERNVRTETKHQLKEYLYTECSHGKDMVDDISVQYFDSSKSQLVQIADVFANIFYSNVVTNGNYSDKMNKMSEEGYLINIFEFPPE